MGIGAKIGLFFAALAMAGIVAFGVRTHNDWAQGGKTFQHAVTHREHQAGEQGDEMKANMEVLRQNTPKADPEAERMIRVLQYAAPGSPPFMQIAMDPAKVKTLPQAQRDASLQTLYAVVRQGGYPNNVMAIGTLGELGDTRAVPFLRQVMRENKGETASPARQALVALGVNPDG